jgi:hypothetical protein
MTFAEPDDSVAVTGVPSVIVTYTTSRVRITFECVTMNFVSRNITDGPRIMIEWSEHLIVDDFTVGNQLVHVVEPRGERLGCLTTPNLDPPVPTSGIVTNKVDIVHRNISVGPSLNEEDGVTTGVL